MLLEQLPRGANHFRGHQRIEHDPAGLAPHEGDVGEIEPADLIDARDHLVEPVIVIELRLTKQRGMDAVELVLCIEKLEPLHVPRHMAGIGHDLEVLHRRDEALLLLLEVSLVGERQRGLGLLEHVQRELRRRLTFGMEMSLQRIDLLRARRRRLEEEAVGQGEGGASGRQ